MVDDRSSNSVGAKSPSQPVVARWIGCFVDDSSRDFQAGPKASGHGFASCWVECMAFGYAYMALQNGGYCSCGDMYSRSPRYHKVADQECAWACIADVGGAEEGLAWMPRGSACGGLWRNAVYELGPVAPANVEVLVNLRARLPPSSRRSDVEAARKRSSAVLGIFVVTAAAESYRQRAQQALLTWAADYPLLLVAAQSDAVLGTKSVPCADDARGGYCCKIVEGFRLALAQFPHASWLAMASDDSFVFPEQLESELQAFNPGARTFIGSASLSVSCQALGHDTACGEVHAAGGAGFALSRPLAAELVRHRDVFLRGCSRDDLHLGHFLRYAFDVHLHSLPGAHHEPRFAELSWHPAVWPPPRCPLPLPRPVFARMGDWGPLRPFAPLDATRLTVLHSHPGIWPFLAKLPAATARLARDEAMLAYLDADGRRLVGPHFEHYRALSLCVYNRTARLDTFVAASEPMHDSDMHYENRPTLRWAAEIGHGDVVNDLCRRECVIRQQASVNAESLDLHVQILKV